MADPILIEPRELGSLFGPVLDTTILVVQVGANPGDAVKKITAVTLKTYMSQNPAESLFNFLHFT